MKKQIAFTIADDNNLPYAKMMINSLRKFHSEEELPVMIIGSKEIAEYDDPDFFYRATPLIASKLIKEYDLVIKLDADQIITGSLDYILDNQYDVGTVYNWNRVDPQVYGEVGFGTIHPREYYNCGLVAMRNERFIYQWLRLCRSHHFTRMPYREQGFLNVLAQYGDYKVVCFDDSTAWYGLVSKGEWERVVMSGDDLILPMGTDGYPSHDKKIKVLHWAGGNQPNKMNYKIFFNEDVIKRLDYLVSDGKDN